VVFFVFQQEVTRVAEVKETAPNKSALNGTITTQVCLDRDVYFQFMALVESHKLSKAAGLNWAMRALLAAAGIKVRADRGTRVRNPPEVEVTK
jgi:hypothetical protein